MTTDQDCFDAQLAIERMIREGKAGHDGKIWIKPAGSSDMFAIQIDPDVLDDILSDKYHSPGGERIVLGRPARR